MQDFDTPLSRASGSDTTSPDALAPHPEVQSLPSTASGRLMPPASTPSGRLVPPDLSESRSQSGRLLRWDEPERARRWSPDPYVTEFTDADFERSVLRSGLPVIVDFWAESCVPCRRQLPVLQDIAERLFGAVRVGRVDVYANPETTRRYKIQGVPHLMVVREGEVVLELVGDHTFRQLAEQLEALGLG